LKVCEICGRVAYYDCAECGKSVCDSHVEKCSKCGRWFCSEHIKLVRGRYVCKKCLSSRIIPYLGVSAVIIFLVCGMIFVVPRFMHRLEITQGGLNLQPDADSETVQMILMLTYRNKSGSALEITNVSFKDEIINSLFKLEYLEKTKIEKDQVTSKLKIVFPNISYEKVQEIKNTSGTLFWKKVYMKKEESTNFSFNKNEIRYPVLLGIPEIPSGEIKEGDMFVVTIEVEILESIPEKCKPLDLIVKIEDENVVTIPEREKRLVIGKESYKFEFMANSSGNTLLKFGVRAADGIFWNEEKEKMRTLPVAVSTYNEIWLSGIKLVDINGKPLELDTNGEYTIKYSKDEQCPRYGLIFAVEGTGKQIIVFIHFDPLLEKVNLKTPDNISGFKLNGEFGTHENGLFFIISGLDGKEEFWWEFEPPFGKTEDFHQTLGVALIKITDETSPSCKVINKSIGRDMGKSMYNFNYNRMLNFDPGCFVTQDGNECCGREFMIRFKKEPEPEPEQTLPPRTSTPTPTPSPTPSPSSLLLASPSIFLFFASFTLFLLSCRSFREGGIL
jgi:hypothetical protein